MDQRRHHRRIPLQSFLTEYVSERPYRAMITDVSESGLRVQRLLAPSHRDSRVVQLEFELPGTGEVIWAKGEACFDELELAPFLPAGQSPMATLHTSGIHVVALATRHARLMRDWVMERRRRFMRELLLAVARHAPA